MESTVNDQILARESADIGVEIEPEPTFLISKDTNNRMEIDVDTSKIQAASGGTLACRTWATKGPSPSKSLAHPAIIDWALAEYLLRAGKTQTDKISLSSDFDLDVGREILDQAIHDFEPARMLNLFQNVIASSPGSITYVFATHPDDPATPRILQHYNRVFIMRDDTPGTLHLHAACARKLTPAMLNTRARDNLPKQSHDPIAMQVLQGNGVGLDDIPDTSEAVVKKFSGVDEDWFMLVMNKDLNFLTDAEIRDIVDNLDYEKYLILLRDAFTNSWKNKTPEDDDDPGVDPAELNKPKAKKPRSTSSGAKKSGSRKKKTAPDEPVVDANLDLLNASAVQMPDETAVIAPDAVAPASDPDAELKVDIEPRDVIAVATSHPNLLPKSIVVVADAAIDDRDVAILESELRRRLSEITETQDLVDYVIRTTTLLSKSRGVQIRVLPAGRSIARARTVIVLD